MREGKRVMVVQGRTFKELLDILDVGWWREVVCHSV